MFSTFKKKDKPLATLRRARDLLKRGFVRGQWIMTADKEWAPADIYGGDTPTSFDTPMSEVLGPEIMNANSCQVCGEGAIYLAAAHEGLTWGQAQELIKAVSDDPKVREAGSIPELNDCGTAQKVLNAIERTEKRIDDASPI